MVYAANYDYIVEKLCVNKDKPEMHCNGKCYLTKKMAQAATHEGATENKLSFVKEFAFTYFEEISHFFLANSLSFTAKHKIADNYQNLYAYLREDSIFHPPSFSI